MFVFLRWRENSGILDGLEDGVMSLKAARCVTLVAYYCFNGSKHWDGFENLLTPQGSPLGGHDYIHIYRVIHTHIDMEINININI